MLAPNDVQHRDRFHDLIAYHDSDCSQRFPNSVIAKEDSLSPIMVEGSDEGVLDRVRIGVSAEGPARALAVARDVCEFLDEKSRARQE
ncbi:MAG: hypothetical protein ACREP9_03555 [Candidatus Dormibacteraceae bacterium]